MKLLPDDPRLTAYALGELDEAGMRLVERAVAGDPALRITLDEIERTCGWMSDVFSGGEARLRPSQRRAVMKAGTAAAASKVIEPARPWRPWSMALAAAAAVILVAALLGHFVAPGSPDATQLDAVALLPAPGPSTGSATRVAAGGGETSAARMAAGVSGGGDAFRKLAAKIQQAPLPEKSALPATTDLAGFSNSAELRLPVVTGTGSAVWVRRWIEERHELPPRDAVRVEEMVNIVTLPMQPLGERLEAGVASMPCPWDARRTLVGVALRAPREAVEGLEMRSVSMRPRRVVGSYAVRSNASLPTTLPAGRSQLVLIEFSGRGDLGVIELVDGTGHAFKLPLVENPEATPRLQRAAALAAYGLWLRGEGVGPEIVREALETTRDDDPIWMETYRGIERALALPRAQR